ncbi:DUF4349 domain-containing protein [Streptomyces scabiei]|uniref:DUF4349 domain-containing protein n=1 Tax=Streptomyces scabiei TaxID=1930 RepID=UPI000765C6A5|nr:DUF4349 domain-containing protein [Streptomyces scabiei]MBP5927932.1 DUF4349 domain-containing protein [Streptomyces sp. LBUM 1479]MDX2531982.1 DUF4349 domain-containing protein [Streptomyces scabiei]MDX2794288.1 DUF4349 domain-containing protein [Streptomyces scabiei]MDX2858814.1 DUF4349 domain-containing protein [Streptomyces scabiei]MDX3822710.1 DUF4349 domain-containing protein [Streptomyces scabiei]
MAHAHVRRSRRPAGALAALFLTGALALAGCSDPRDGGGSLDSASDTSKSNKSAARQEGALNDESGSGYSEQGAADAPVKIAPSHIIRTASLTVRVKDVPKALDEARTAVESVGGFVGSESTTLDGEDRERTRVVLRVPSDKYEQVLGDLEGTGKLIARKEKAEDVTDQVVDVDSRIKTQRASVARIRELMDRAGKLSDVVTLEGELSSRQADLESLLAQQKSLKDRASLATITLSLSETAVKKADKADDEPGFVDALAGGWNAFVAVFRWLAMALAAILPFAVVTAVVVFLWLRLTRTRRPAPATAAAAAAPVLEEREEPSEREEREERSERE